MINKFTLRGIIRENPSSILSGKVLDQTLFTLWSNSELSEFSFSKKQKLSTKKLLSDNKIINVINNIEKTMRTCTYFNSIKLII
jgi:hypothetical protein